MVYGFPSTDEEVLKEIDKYKPRFVIISAFFQGNQQWHYEFPQKHQDFLKPAGAFFVDAEKTQPVVVILEIDYTKFKI